MRGEVYRVLRKRSLYIYFGVIAALYAILVFVRMGTAGAESMLTDADSLFVFLPALAGGYLFAALYTDDLHAKNLTALIGFGMGKTRIVLCKLILTTLFGAAVFGLVPVFMYAVYAAFGVSTAGGIVGMVYAYALRCLLTTLACAALSAIAVYGLQRATFGIVLYVLLSLGVVDQMLSMLLDWEVISNLAPGLSEHLLSGIVLRLFFGIVSEGRAAVAEPAAEYVVRVGVATLLSAWAFHKKELEF